MRGADPVSNPQKRYPNEEELAAEYPAAHGDLVQLAGDRNLIMHAVEVEVGL